MTSSSFRGVFFCGGIVASMMTMVAYATQLTWQRNQAFDDVLPVNIDMTSTVPETTDVACGMRCMKKSWCNTFFYNYVNRQCLRQRMVYDIPRNSTPEPGWQYFKIVGDRPGYFTDRVSGSRFHVDRRVTITGGWSEGRNHCLEHGEDLAVLEPVVKAHFVRDFLLTNGLPLDADFHIGARRLNPSDPFPPSGPDFVWVNGQTLSMAATSDFRVPGHPKFYPNKGSLELSGLHGFMWKEANHLVGKKFSLCEKALSVGEEFPSLFCGHGHF